MGDRIEGALEDIEALILAGGFGTRIRSVLGPTPKALAPVNGVPFLDILLGALVGEGLTRAILCLGFGAPSIVEHVDRSRFEGLELAISIERSPLGTGGALRLALPLVRSQVVLVLNGDTFLDLDWAGFVGRHTRTEALVTVACVHSPDRSAMGAIECDERGRVVIMAEKDPLRAGPGWASTGTHLMHRRVLESIPFGVAVSLEREVLPALIGKGFCAYLGVRRMDDIGTPAGLDAASRW